MADSNAHDIVVVGSCMVDLIFYVHEFPKTGQTIHGHRYQQGFGGKGANQAVMAAKLGGNVAMVSRLGDDAFGTATKANFDAMGVDASAVEITAGQSSGLASIYVDDAGDNEIVLAANANTAITVADVEAAAPAIEAAAVLLTQCEIPLEATIAALKIAQAAGTVAVFNPAPADAALPDEIYEFCDYVCPNETELAVLSGCEVTDPATAETAARVLMDKGAKAVLVTLGSQGSLLVTADSAKLCEAYEVEAVDTTGAGDCFLGTFAYFLATGVSPLTAIDKANRVASFSVQAAGTQTSFPTRDDISNQFSKFFPPKE